MARELGLIKWYGGYNKKKNSYNQFGFIQRHDDTDLYVHRSALLCNEAELEGKENILVVFEVSENPKDSRLQAYNVRRFTEEWCTLERDNDVTSQAKLIDQLSQLLHKSSIRQDILDDIPDSVKIHPLISKYLNPEDRLSLLMTRNEEYTYDFIVAEVIDILLRDRQLIQKVPKHLRLDPRLFAFLDAKDKLEYLLHEFTNKQSNTVVEQIVGVLASNKNLIDSLPEVLKMHHAILPLLSTEEQMSLLLRRVLEQPSEELILQIEELLTENEELWTMLSINLKLDMRLFPNLPPSEQVELVWPPSEPKFWDYWDIFSDTAKILAVFRAAKEDINLFSINHNLKATNPLVQVALNILWAKYNSKFAQKAFERAHKILETFVVNDALNSTDALDLSPLLPSCLPNHVLHCEGRPWPTDEDKVCKNPKASRAYCSRIRNECRLFESSSDSNETIYLSDISF